MVYNAQKGFEWAFKRSAWGHSTEGHSTQHGVFFCLSRGPLGSI